MHQRSIVRAAACLCMMALHPQILHAQDEAPADNNGGVKLILPENVELKVFTDYVSQRLNLNILYDEQIANKKVTIKAPEEVPADSLLGLLESTLKMKGLALVDAEQKGWKKIVQVRNLADIAAPPDQAEQIGDDAGATQAVTRVFELKFATPQRVDQLIKPFLSQPGGNSFQLAEHNIVIVTDFVDNVRRVAQLIEIADRTPAPVTTKFQLVKNMTAAELAQRVTQVLTAQATVQGLPGAGGGAGGAGGAGLAGGRLDLLPNERTNQIIIVGNPAAVEQAAAMATELDVPLGLETRVYAFKSASPERVDRLIKQLIGDLTAKLVYQSAIDQDANLLIVTTTDAVHAQLAELKDDLDEPIAQDQSPMQFYTLQNTTATEVLDTIRTIEGEMGLSADMIGAVGDQPKRGRDLTRVPGTTGPNTPTPGSPGSMPAGGEDNLPPELPRPPGYRPSERSGEGGSTPPASPRGLTGLGGESVRTTFAGGDARVMADVNTNTIIVVADSQTQRVYAQLIERLDKRRPQVLLEATIVTLDTSGGYSFGVEISKSTDVGDDGKLFTFSSFGLSEVDADTGRLSLTPGLGFNGALISADIADIIIRALKTNARARVVSAPRILVKDNATGTLTSVNEAPFTSVNASDTVATTSFAGFASAGTTVTMTPHIAEGDHLQLEYEIDLSSFTGDGSETVPPPRQTNAISSEVMIPDGSTIIVGGLKRNDESYTRATIPLIGDIPILGDIIGSTTKGNSETTLFVFIRPVILRDDSFRDLKHLSERDVEAAEIPSDYPTSDALWMK